MSEPKRDEIIQRLDQGLLTAVVDDELIGMSVEQGACYGMNAVATRIWDLLAEPRTIDALCGQLVDEYAVDPQSCRRDVLAHLERLRAAKLVQTRRG